MTTDFFISSRKEIDSINMFSDIKKFPMIYAKRVDSVKISTLDELLTKEDVEITEPMKKLESGDAWIIPVRKKLIEKLANLNTKDLTQLASDWSKTEEWQLDNGNELDLKEFLYSFSQFASQAQNEGKEIFVFIQL